LTSRHPLFVLLPLGEFKMNILKLTFFMVHRMSLLGRNFATGLLCVGPTLKPKT